MTTYLLYAPDKKLEVLDVIGFEIGMKILIPVWEAKPMVVSDIIFTTNVAGASCSMSQMVYVKKQK